ncbi:MAG: hypothetical protein ABGY72_13660, partial [bacterium]
HDSVELKGGEGSCCVHRTRRMPGNGHQAAAPPGLATRNRCVAGTGTAPAQTGRMSPPIRPSEPDWRGC